MYVKSYPIAYFRKLSKTYSYHIYIKRKKKVYQ